MVFCNLPPPSPLETYRAIVSFKKKQFSDFWDWVGQGKITTVEKP